MVNALNSSRVPNKIDAHFSNSFLAISVLLSGRHRLSLTLQRRSRNVSSFTFYCLAGAPEILLSMLSTFEGHLGSSRPGNQENLGDYFPHNSSLVSSTIICSHRTPDRF